MTTIRIVLQAEYKPAVRMLNEQPVEQKTPKTFILTPYGHLVPELIVLEH